MNENSFHLHCGRMVLHQSLRIALTMVLAVAATACYSFRGGSVPEHLRTVSISSVLDNSGYGDPTFRETATETLVRRFRSDNSLQVVDDDGDARLNGTILRVQDQIMNVQGADLEGQRKLSVTMEVEYFDAVKNRTVWKRSFENFDVYDASNATEERAQAARKAIERIADDILLAVVSDW
ncbi:MAG TPA: hypothetical protein DIS79_00595 [Bacteroidetes bacterium]|nr:hypothetical protein [Bacteroidota bacterium]